MKQSMQAITIRDYLEKGNRKGVPGKHESWGSTCSGRSKMLRAVPRETACRNALWNNYPQRGSKFLKTHAGQGTTLSFQRAILLWHNKYDHEPFAASPTRGRVHFPDAWIWVGLLNASQQAAAEITLSEFQSLNLKRHWNIYLLFLGNCSETATEASHSSLKDEQPHGEEWRHLMW